MGPAPAVADIRRAVRHLLSASTGTVIVACSGGADSLALAAATAFVAPRLGIRAGLVTIDHGLQAGSAEQADRVVGLATGLGLEPADCVRVDVARAGGPEAAARAARYAALDAMADRLDARILLGHTLDDQAETVLLGLGRGSGPRSIAGMTAVDGRYLRPFLALRRTTIQAACAALGLAPWTDPQNSDPRFQRVRLRSEVLPLLEDVLQGGVAEALARTAGLLRADADALDAAAQCFFANHTSSGHEHADGLDVTALAAQPAAIRTRVLRIWAHQVGAGVLSAERTAALDGLVVDWHGQGAVDLPGGVAALRASGRLVVSPRSDQSLGSARPGRNN